MTITQFLKSCRNADKKAEKKNEKKYWKPSEFKDIKDGETRFRVVCPPIHGWIDWLDKTPFRYRDDEEPAKSFDETKPMEQFWCLYVWDYDRKDLFILEVKQSSIRKKLAEIMEDEDWADITAYDIKVKKEGKLKLTKYTVSPALHKPMAEEIKEAIKRAPVRLEALYEGGNPWKDLEPKERHPEATDTNSVQFLAKVLTDSIVFPEKELVAHYLEFARPKLSKPLEEAIDIWLDRPDDLLKAYGKWLLSDNARQIRDSLQT